MGVDMYLKLKPETTDAQLCTILSIMARCKVLPIHLAIFRAMRQVAPTWSDDEAWYAANPMGNQDNVPTYRYWALLHETPALAVLHDFLGMSERGYTLYLGRAHHFWPPLTPEGYIEANATHDVVEMTTMLMHVFDTDLIPAVFEWMDAMYWG